MRSRRSRSSCVRCSSPDPGSKIERSSPEATSRTQRQPSGSFPERERMNATREPSSAMRNVRGAPRVNPRVRAFCRGNESSVNRVYPLSQRARSEAWYGWSPLPSRISEPISEPEWRTSAAIASSSRRRRPSPAYSPSCIAVTPRISSATSPGERSTPNPRPSSPPRRSRRPSHRGRPIETRERTAWHGSTGWRGTSSVGSSGPGGWTERRAVVSGCRSATSRPRTSSGSRTSSTSRRSAARSRRPWRRSARTIATRFAFE